MNAPINRICWWLVDRLSRRLEPGERDVVLGDIAESGENGREALRDLAGLAVRRQAASLVEAWSEVWSEVPSLLSLGLALAGLIAPVGMFVRGLRPPGSWLEEVIGQLHALMSQGVLEESAMTQADNILRLVCGILLIAGWAAIAGFVLGSVLRRSAWVYAASVCLLWWLSIGAPMRVMFGVPLRQILVWLTIQLLLILIPFLVGVDRGVRSGSLGVGRMALLAAAISALTLIMQVEDARQTLAYELWRNGGSLGWQLVWAPRALPFLAILWELGVLTAVKEKNI
jgi:hypothetical protein